MLNTRQKTAKLGEDIAVEFLQHKGYKILKRNYRCRLGEIDIIAQKKGIICFIEVKMRSSLKRGLPQESIGDRKKHKLSKVALFYLKTYNLISHPARFDVVSILRDKGYRKISLIENAFNLSSCYAY
jgi:putative endonuclease